MSSIRLLYIYKNISTYCSDIYHTSSIMKRCCISKGAIIELDSDPIELDSDPEVDPEVDPEIDPEVDPDLGLEEGGGGVEEYWDFVLPDKRNIGTVQ